jgi:transcription elongation factor GreA
MQAKINLLRDKLARAVIVERAKETTGEVVFGATIVVKDLKYNAEETYVLVGAGEEDFDAGRINVASPLAQGFLGRKVGDRVSIDVPAGTLSFQILEVRFDD